MSYIRSFFVVLGLLMLSASAFAMGPMNLKPHGGRGGVMMRHAMMHPAVPMLLPLAEMRSYALHLSDHQVSALATWRNRHMRQAMPLMKQLRTDKSALRRGLLAGDNQAVLNDVMGRFNADRAHLLQIEVAQVRMVHRTLSLHQWQKLLRMYRRMRMMSFGMMHR